MELIPQYPPQVVKTHLSQHACDDIVGEIFGYLHNQQYFDELQELKQIYRGVQDIEMENKYDNLVRNVKEHTRLGSRFVQTREAKQQGSNSIKQAFCIYIPQDEIAKRVRISNLEGIESIQLISGGCILETIYDKVFPIMQKMYNTKEDEIPFFIFQMGMPYLTFQNIEILVSYLPGHTPPVEQKITYDLYRYEDPNGNTTRPHPPYLNGQSRTQFPILQVQKSNSGYFGHPVIALLVDTDYEGELFVKFNKIIRPYQFRDNGLTILALSEHTDIETAMKYGVNFSRMPDKISITKADGEVINPIVYAMNTQLLIFGSGCVGVRYCT